MLAWVIFRRGFVNSKVNIQGRVKEIDRHGYGRIFPYRIEGNGYVSQSLGSIKFEYTYIHSSYMCMTVMGYYNKRPLSEVKYMV